MEVVDLTLDERRPTLQILDRFCHVVKALLPHPFPLSIGLPRLGRLNWHIDERRGAYEARQRGRRRL